MYNNRLKDKAYKAMYVATEEYAENIPSEVRERYVNMLLMRAVKFYVENNLDALTVEEDMYREEDDEGIPDPDFANLAYSENSLIEWLKDITHDNA